MFHRVNWPATSNSPVPPPSHTGRIPLYVALAACVVALVGGVVALSEPVMELVALR
jgi:hypothetical protein